MKKRICHLVFIAVMMFLLPWLTVTFAGSAGMAICFILFFAVNPIFSVFIGCTSGKEMKSAWYVPFINAAAFLLSAWILFDMGETAFVWYALFYLILGYVVFGITAGVCRSRTREEIKKSKLFNYIVFSFFMVTAIFLFSCFVVDWNEHHFTKEKWIKNTEERYKIVNDFLQQYEIVGMLEQEIISLLGEETEDAPIQFKVIEGVYPDANHLTYDLGTFYIDREWLIITVENGVVIQYVMGLT